MKYAVHLGGESALDMAGLCPLPETWRKNARSFLWRGAVLAEAAAHADRDRRAPGVRSSNDDPLGIDDANL